MTDTTPVAGLDAETTLTTWKDFSFRVRPARPDDEPLLAELFRQVSLEDRRFRFLTGVGEVGHALLERLVAVDHDRSENFLAFDGDKPIGTAMLAADPGLQRAEVAISLDADYKNRGIGWALLDHLARYAERRGIKRIESVESRENRQALAVEADMGFRVEPYPGDPGLVLVSKDLGASSR
jgi:GNAT superfamily N-acetyltransferase